MLEQLFDTTRALKDDVFRNIVGQQYPKDPFTDLIAGDSDLAKIANSATTRIQTTHKTHTTPALHFTTAIGYPFYNEKRFASRYSDGSFPIWYGSLELTTSIYETVFHMVCHELNIEGIEAIPQISRERAVYQVNCKAILIDLADKTNQYPELLANDYQFTQNIGKRLHQEGHPGLLAPSARYDNGVNVNIFNINVLNNPRSHCYLKYKFDPKKMSVTVEKEDNQEWLHIDASTLLP